MNLEQQLAECKTLLCQMSRKLDTVIALLEQVTASQRAQDHILESGPAVWRKENGRIVYAPTTDGLFERWLESIEPGFIKHSSSGDVEWARAVWDAARNAGGASYTVTIDESQWWHKGPGQEGQE